MIEIKSDEYLEGGGAATIAASYTTATTTVAAPRGVLRKVDGCPGPRTRKISHVLVVFADPPLEAVFRRPRAIERRIRLSR